MVFNSGVIFGGAEFGDQKALKLASPVTSGQQDGFADEIGPKNWVPVGERMPFPQRQQNMFASQYQGATVAPSSFAGNNSDFQRAASQLSHETRLRSLDHSKLDIREALPDPATSPARSPPRATCRSQSKADQFHRDWPDAPMWRASRSVPGLTLLDAGSCAPMVSQLFRRWNG
jgi:hypothetical protein